MKRAFSKRRFWLVVAALAVAEALAIGLVMRWDYIFPSGKVSEVYARYEHAEGIEVSYVEKYRISDSIWVDVTLVDATTDSAWEALLCEINISPPAKEELDFLGAEYVEMRLAPKHDHSLAKDSVLINNDLIVVSWAKRSISIFPIASKQQFDAIIIKQIDDITPNT